MENLSRMIRKIILVVVGLGSVGCDDRAGSSAPLSSLTVVPRVPPRVDLRGADPAVIQAVRSAREKVTASPRLAAAWGHLAMVLLAHDIFADAATCFAKAAQLAPDDARWPYLRGLGLLEGNPDPAAALPVLKTAAGLSTGEPVPRLKFGEVLLEQGLIDEAERQFLLALELEPGNARAQLGLGRVA